MLRRLLVVTGVAILWGASFYGALALAKVDLGQWAGLCGPWGCLPETGPLMAVHGMWLSLIGGASWLARLAVPILRSWQPWAGIMLATTLFTVTMLGIECFNYVRLGGESEHLLQLSVYKLAIWTDWPLLQIMLCSSVNLGLSAFRTNAGTKRQVQGSSDETGLSEPFNNELPSAT